MIDKTISVKDELLLIIKQNGNCCEPDRIQLKCSDDEEGLPVCPMSKTCDRLMNTHRDNWEEAKRDKVLVYCLKKYSKEDLVEGLI